MWLSGLGESLLRDDCWDCLNHRNCLFSKPSCPKATQRIGNLKGSVTSSAASLDCR